MKIYIDLLVLTNSLLTMIALEIVGLFVHRKISPVRILLSSLTGGLFSLIMILNGNTYGEAVLITLLKIAGIMLSLLFCFKFHNIRQYFLYLLVYIFVRLVFLGITLVLWEISKTKIIYVKNFTFYFDISLLKLTICVISAYILLSLYEFITRRIADKTGSYTAVFRCGNYELRLPAQADSGNKLCDSFTGIPVVIFYCSEMYSYFFPEDISENLRGFRLIPYNTVNGNGLIPVTSKGEVSIIDDKENEKKIKCCVGILKSEDRNSRAIFNPYLLK